MSETPRRDARQSSTSTDGTDARGRSGWKTWALRLVAMAGGLFLLLVVVLAVAYARTSIPDPKTFAVQQATTFTYADGTQMGRLGANRESVPLSQVPDGVQKAVLAAEDRNYYSEPGISPTGILRAALANLKGGEISQGASTITQQYVKNAYLSDQRTFSRKFSEILIALKLSRTESKDQVLEAYLNTVYFGRGAYGVQTAAKAYYGKDVKDLTPAEGALLAEQLRGPALYDPVDHPAAAKARFDYVIKGMKSKGWLAAGSDVTFPKVIPVSSAGSSSGLQGPTGYLIRQAQAELQAKGLDENTLIQQGVTVTLTVDKKAQDAAVAAVDGVLGKDAPADLLTPLIAVVPGDGAIKAEYAGRNYNADQFNAVTQGRAQAGSTFKAYTLAAALKQGISLNSMWDGNSPLDVPGYGKPVRNYNNESLGQIDLLTATADSVNTVYVPLAIKAGIKNVAETAIDLGIRSADVDPAQLGASISLGTASVFPVDQAEAYAALAARGQRAAPYLVAKVTSSRGDVLLQTKPQTEGVLDQQVADQTTFALEGVVQHGTASAAQLAGGRPAAGKTGTTDNSQAAWFNGYTPQLSTVVGFFYRDSAKPITGVAGVNGQITGASGPARIWKAFMDAALAGQPIVQFPAVTIAPASTTPSPLPTSASPSASPTSASPSPTQSSAAPSVAPSVAPSIVVPSIVSSPTSNVSPISSPSASPTPPSASSSPAAAAPSANASPGP